MKRRTFVLHKKLTDIVHRKDMSVLTIDLKAKREFVISIKMTDYQKYLYKVFMLSMKEKKELFYAFQGLMRLCGHPGILAQHSLRVDKAKKMPTIRQLARVMGPSVAQAQQKILEELSTEVEVIADIEENLLSQDAEPDTRELNLDYDKNEEEAEEEVETRAYDFWRLGTTENGAVCDLSTSEFLSLGTKLMFFLHLLVECVKNGDKVLVFTQSIDTLNFIETILKSDDWGDALNIESDEDDESKYKFSRWSLGCQYGRLDGEFLVIES